MLRLKRCKGGEWFSLLNDFNVYFESICSRGFFFPKITLPTRIQPPSFSLIDNILTNDIDKTNSSTSGLLINDLSDHNLFLPSIKTSHIWLK